MELTTNNVQSPKASGANARVSLNGNYSSIVFDGTTGYLVFPSSDVFNAAINSLADEMTNFQYDKGQTNYLIELISNSNGNGNVKNELIENSPLSSEVLVKFLSSNFPPGIVKEVLFENIQLSEEVNSVYQIMELPIGIREAIDQKRLDNISYNHPVLAEFEKLFSGYLSLRKKTITDETAFLKTGGDPESVLNPANKITNADVILSTLLNHYGEVKIGNEIGIVLPSKDIKIKNGDQNLVNYIRTHGDVPHVISPVSEPVNGLPKSSNPAPFDTNIEVESNDLYILNCGDVEVLGDDQRVVFINHSGDDKNQFYWDFGDGFVSYKQSPVHTYTDGVATHTVTTTVYDQSGARCEGGGIIISQGGGSGLCNAVMIGSSQGLIGNFSATPTGGYAPFTYTWNFGDGTALVNGTTGNISHTYSQAGNYSVSLTMVDATGCSLLMFLNMTLAIPTNPPSSSCKSSDKEKAVWKSTDNTHKFNHKFKLKNFFGFGSPTLTATVQPHYKLFGVWLPSWTPCAVGFDGIIFTPLGFVNCGTSHQIQKSSQTLSVPQIMEFYMFGGVQTIYYESNNPLTTIGSAGTAFGGNSILYLD